MHLYVAKDYETMYAEMTDGNFWVDSMSHHVAHKCLFEAFWLKNYSKLLVLMKWVKLRQNVSFMKKKKKKTVKTELWAKIDFKTRFKREYLKFLS